MSIENRPKAAIALRPDGRPWYPYREVLAGPILYIQNPVLPDPSCVWAGLFRGDSRVHLDLTDQSVLTEAIYLSHADPAGIFDVNLADTLEHAMYLCRCNPRILSGMVWDEVGDMLMISMYPRMQDCREAARRLLSVEQNQKAGVV